MTPVSGLWSLIVMMANGQADANNWPPVTFLESRTLLGLLAFYQNTEAQNLTTSSCSFCVALKPPVLSLFSYTPLILHRFFLT